MSLLDKASLLVTPNAYKSGTLYSVIPSDGSGDMTFTRASTATRVNADGLVEEMPYNLLTYTEEFDNAAWVKNSGITITANAGTAPNGTLTADKLVPPVGTSSTYFISQSSSGNCMSIFAKAAEKSKMLIYSGIANSNAYFDLLNGQVLTTLSNVSSATIEDCGNGWYRCSVVWNTTSTLIRIYAVDNDNSTTVTGNGTDGIYIWGAQLVKGSTAKDYFPIGATRNNFPRLDYSNGSCPSLLLEPQRTNLLTYSEQFDNAYWGKSNVSASANTTTAPDGTLTADKIIENTSNSNHEINHTNIPLSAASYSYSVYAKADGRNWMALSIQGQYTYFDLQNGVVGTSAVGNINEIKSAGNGWYRCTITRTATAANNFGLIRLAIDDNTPTYTGDGTSGLFIWGAQLEAGSYPTSYIPTTSASVTRVADSCSKTGISSLIGQTEGTMFLDFVYSNIDLVAAQIFALSDGTAANRIYIGSVFNNKIQTLVATSSVTQCNIISSFDMVLGQRYKAAIAYSANDFAFYVNGVQIGTDNSGSVPATSRIANDSGAGSSNMYRPINLIYLSKERLSNDELAQLTTI